MQLIDMSQQENSSDPDTWLVYADLLEEAGDEQGAIWARFRGEMLRGVLVAARDIHRQLQGDPHRHLDDGAAGGLLPVAGDPARGGGVPAPGPVHRDLRATPAPGAA